MPAISLLLFVYDTTLRLMVGLTLFVKCQHKKTALTFLCDVAEASYLCQPGFVKLEARTEAGGTLPTSAYATGGAAKPL